MSRCLVNVSSFKSNLLQIFFRTLLCLNGDQLKNVFEFKCDISDSLLLSIVLSILLCWCCRLSSKKTSDTFWQRTKIIKETKKEVWIIRFLTEFDPLPQVDVRIMSKVINLFGFICLQKKISLFYFAYYLSLDWVILRGRETEKWEIKQRKTERQRDERQRDIERKRIKIIGWDGISITVLKFQTISIVLYILISLMNSTCV